MSFSLPKRVQKATVPPIKIQGIKTDLVDFIASNVEWSGDGRWVEPFLGSGVVLFNIEPPNALVADKNKYIIKLYRAIQSGRLDHKEVRKFLEKHGDRLKNKGEDYYYKMRDEFNDNGNPLYMLFLNRSCYNGMMRFNLSGEFNVPFCRKPERFRKAYVTRIVNQVKDVSRILHDKNWKFKALDWQDTLEEVGKDDFVYLDPPYVGRNTGYSGEWTEENDDELVDAVKDLPCGFAMSTWIENKYRSNDRVDDIWDNTEVRSYNHFYYVGSTEDLRNEMEEGLIIKEGYGVPKHKFEESEQGSLFEG